MPGLYGLGNANVTTSVSNTTGLYIGSGQASILNNAQQLLSLLSNNGTVLFALDPITGNTKVLADANGASLYGNANVAAFLNSGGVIPINTTGNVTASYFFGDGSQLTGLPATFGNANVSAYLSSGTDTGNIITSGNISGAYIIGNGSQLTGLPSSNIQLTGNVTGTGTTGSPINTLIAASGVTAGTYGNSTTFPTFTVGADGRVTNAGYVAIAGTTVVQGTTNQVNVSAAGSTYTISLPTDLIAPGNITAGNLTTTGDVRAQNLRASNSVFASGIIADTYQSASNPNPVVYMGYSSGTGIVYSAGSHTFSNVASVGTASGNIYAAYVSGTLSTSSQPNITTVGNLTALNVAGDSILYGNLQVLGNTTYINSNVITTNDLNITVGNNQSTGSALNNAGIDVGSNNLATWRFNNPTYSWQSNIDITPTSNVTLNLGGASNYWNNFFVANVLASGAVNGDSLAITNPGNIGTVLIGDASNNSKLSSTKSGSTYIEFNPTGASTTTTYAAVTHTFAGNVNIVAGGGGSTGNLSAVNITTSGNITGNANMNNILANSFTVSGTFTAANISTTGNVTATGTITGNALVGNTLTLSGNATVGNLSTSGVSGNISGANYIISNYFVGDGGLLTNVATNYGNTNVAAYLPTYTGNLVSLTGNVTTTANVSAAYLLGNGSQLTSLTGAQVTGTVANATYATSAGSATTADLATYVTGNAQANITSVGTLSNLTVSGNVTPGAVNTTGNVSASYFLGNGAFLTGITAGSTYGDSNVTTLLASLGSNVISSTANITTTANVSAAYLLGNGAAISGLAPTIRTNISVTSNSGTYTNSNITYNSSTGVITYNEPSTVTSSERLIVPVKNTSGGTLTKGTPVYPTGTVGVTDTFEVSASRADTAGTMPPLGLLEQDLANNATGYAIQLGLISSVDTSTYSIGQILYVAATGGLTGTRPNNGYIVNPIGTVGRVNAVTGSIVVNIWNYFQLPNLGSGNIWLGNANSIPTETVFSTLANSTISSYLPTYTGNISAGNVTVTGNISADYLTGNVALAGNLGAAQINYLGRFGNAAAIIGQSLGAALGNASYPVGAPGQNTIQAGQISFFGNSSVGGIIQNTNAWAANTFPSPNRIWIGDNGPGDYGATLDVLLNNRGASTVIAGGIPKYDNGVRESGLVSSKYYNLPANVGTANTNSRIGAITGDLVLTGPGSYVNTAPQLARAAAYTFVVGFPSSATYGFSNTNVTSGAGTISAFQVCQASTVGNAFVFLSQVFGNNAGGGSPTITNSIGFASYAPNNVTAHSGNVITVYNPGTTNTMGITQSNLYRRAPGYYFLKNEDDVAQNQLGSLLQYHEYRANTASTTGTVDINKSLGQVQYLVPTGNVTIGSFQNFVTSASDSVNTDWQADTVTLAIAQSATPYTITMPTGNTQIKYAGGTSTVANTANAVTLITTTAMNIAGTTTYLVSISSEFS